MIKAFLFVFLSVSWFVPSKLHAQVRKVTITKESSKWQLRVNNEPFYIRGAGGTVQMDAVIACGGNTIRTWGIENAQTILDQAEKKGLKVMLGLWVQHERHGFDYNDPEKIKNQLEGFRIAVRKYKDHPALLMWGVGNEYELEYSNTKVWAAVNDIAKMVHEEDKNHPTSTVTAGTNAEKLNFVQTVLTEIDIYGINTYGDIESVKGVLTNGNYTGAYMITEWGPNGHWESPKTIWGMSVEQTSTEKAAVYLKRYQTCIAADSAQCIGSFAFLWGQKQEYTSTWYGLFSDEGIPTEAIDELTFCWSGAYPQNRSPRVDSMQFDNHKLLANCIVASNSMHSFRVFAKDLNQDKLSYSWELYPESTDLKSGGDAEMKPPLINGRLKGKNQEKVNLKAPVKEGRYRLFVRISDGEKLAYMNIPFYVEPGNENERIHFKEQTLKSFDEE
ncbi:MAG: hypothetical protein NWS40_07020 [Crocinitomicaceae bacterium]|jgi:hypothetical protein|nr:hypothetical protein [Crocinitomicaceae bacterium]MDP5011264.1 hypothetical protein [Crocinitomicaceae bacterium]